MRYYSRLKGPSSKKCSTCEAVEAMDTEGRGSFLSLHRLAELCLLRIQQCVASVKNKTSNLAGVAQWIERWPANQRVAGSIPNQGICLGCRPGPQYGVPWSLAIPPGF